ncbi:oleate hydratase [Aspergillus thermomutatus]|uniref:Oleate hydratase n=1 Tax=Aspergillus thermomutatus TaxID=41047 RepID=A0A397G2P9_ASPTH|nr:uncharacterized protein CDV56_100208 [Aspergillus thermomutatus]RHZ44349.1 hypothetical protein CDV56_100208 [Aspergillus thermomutatus]
MADRSRDPKNIQAWLVGSGIESLAAAVHLIHDSKVPGPNIHILDLHEGCGGRMKTFGDATDGYFLPVECHPHFHGPCTERFLSLVPSDDPEYSSIMQAVRAFSEEQSASATPKIKHGIQLDLKHRMDLIWFLMESEHALGSKSINQVFDMAFFQTDFWTLWSTTFGLQPWHSAVEFHRHLRKYLDDIQSLHSIRSIHRTKFNLYDSLIRPLTTHLQSQGVDFRFQIEVTNLETYPASDPTTVSAIHLRQDTHEYLVTLDPQDVCIVTLGSTTTSAAMGTNTSPPPPLSHNWEAHLISEWGLWQTLAKQAPKFGDPAFFLSRAVQATVETFTTTLRGRDFLDLYDDFTREHGEARPGWSTWLPLKKSTWALSLNLPPQPVFPDQPDDTYVLLGYALNPAGEGNSIRKPMYECSGREVFEEVLGHLGITKSSVLEGSVTVPCGLPLGTAPFVARRKGDRPRVIPPDTTNIACVGQFVEMDEDTTLSMEYSVRSAQVAVSGLMGTGMTTGRIKKNVLWEVFDLIKA